MGEVHVALDEKLERRVALKSIRPERRLSPAARARFLREARVLSRLDHPGICRIFDYIEEDGHDYLVLELIEGRDLQSAIAEGLDRAPALEIAERIGDALVAAHAAGVVHRDLKPANVMLDASGHVRVLDFGLAFAETQPENAAGESSADAVALSGDATEATLAPDEDLDASVATRTRFQPAVTTVGAVVGTLEFMSPEQARGEPVTAASDVYSYGLLVQWLVTGRSPHEPGLDARTLLRRARRAETLPPTGAGRDLVDWIERLKSRAPTRRPTAVEAVERLRWIRSKPRRRLRNLAVAAAITVLAAGGLKYTLDLRRERAAAVAAQAEADRRREQAEDLIGFMLGDLRERLRPVGRLDVLDAVGDRAMAYFSELTPEERAQDGELYRRSRALVQIGEVRMEQGSVPEALDAFRAALDLAEELAARDPSNGTWQVQLGAAHFWIGSVFLYQGKLHEAMEPFEAYLRIAQDLVRADPESLDYQLELAYAHTNMASVEAGLGRAQAALKSIRQSVEINRRLVDVVPENAEWRRGLANGLSWMASILEDRGELQAALDGYRQELDLRQVLVDESPDDADARSLLAISHSHVGDLLRALGRPSEARHAFDEDLRLISELNELDPANEEWRFGLALAWHKLGELFFEMRDPQARTSFGRAEGALEELVRKDPDQREWSVMLAAVRIESGRLDLVDGAAERTWTEVAPVVATLRTLLEQDPEDLRCRQWLGRGYLLLGQAAQSLGRAQDAGSAWSDGLRVLEKGASGSRDHSLLEPMARILLHLGAIPQARRVVEQLRASGYGQTDFVDFCAKRGLSLGQRSSALVTSAHQGG